MGGKYQWVFPKNILSSSLVDIVFLYNLSKIKDGEYIINLDAYKSIGTHWIALYGNDNNVTYFDIFGVNSSKRN